VKATQIRRHANTSPYRHAEVGGRGGEGQVDGIANDTAEAIAAEPEVALRVADPRLDVGTVPAPDVFRRVLPLDQPVGE